MSSQKFDYHSEQINSKNNKTRRNIVNIANNKGTKRVEEYDSQGKIIHTREKPLNSSEIGKIKNNIFIPGLFKNCCPKTRSVSKRLNAGNLRSKTRSTNGRRN